MPRKKKNSHARSREIQIRTRLLELSMKVEDFIYQKIPISKTAAESFIEEVNSYKIKCYKDERSLQVIEKLTRCMKAIIVEHQEDHENSLMDDIRPNSVSPVYSLPDEDRTQFSQDLEITTLNPINVFKNTPVHSYTYNRTSLNQDLPNNKNVAAGIISLDNDYEDNSMIVVKDIEMTSNVSVDVGIREGLSDLSININNEQMYVPGTECSQSILNDFEKNNNLQQKATIRSISVSKTNDNTILRNQIPVVVNDSIIKKTTLDECNINNHLAFKVSKAINNTLNYKKQKESIIVTGQIDGKANYNLCANNTKNCIRQTCTTNTDTGIIDVHLDGAVQSVKDTKCVVQTNSNITNKSKPFIVNNISKDTPICNSNIEKDNYVRPPFSQNLKNNIINNHNTLTEIIDLCNIPDVENNYLLTNTNIDMRSNDNVDVGMHKALSNLSVKDTVNDETMNTDVDCSQSILKNFEENNTQQRPTTLVGSTIPNKNNNANLQNKAPAVINNPNKIVKPIIVQKQHLNNHNQLILKVSKAINNNFNPNTPVNNAIVATNIVEKVNDNLHTHKTINYTQQSNSSNTDTTFINKTCNSTEVYHNITQNSKNIKPIAETKTNVTNGRPITVKRKRPPRKNKVNHNEIANTDSALKHLNLDNTDQVIKRRPRKTYSRKKKDSNKDSVVPIYNKNTANDLSWLEGIRFVREIGEDEYDKKLSDLNEDFWDNYYLPPNFDESDFV